MSSKLIKNQFRIYLLLIPSLFLSSDFLPTWIIFTLTTQLVLISFAKIHYAFFYINFPLVLLVFNSIGKKVIPETMIPCLALFLVCQIGHNRYKERNEAFIFFLWLGIFSIFSSSFYYLSYCLSVLTYYFIVQASDKSLNLKAILKTFSSQKYQLLATAVLATILFIFFPRFQSFLPSANTSGKGKIGYSKDINNSNTSNLELSSQTAFYAEIDKTIPQENLYWRGRVHAYTDGYNWREGSLSPVRISKYKNEGQEFITTKMKYEQDLSGDVIVLDPVFKILKSNLNSYSIKSTNEYRFYNKPTKATLVAQSYLNQNQVPKRDLHLKNKKQYLQTPSFIPAGLTEITKNIKGNSANEIINSFKNHIVQNQFSYTLKPGKIPTMKSFLQGKKGYCTHFASFLGIVLRLKNIPSRLVSGFQGGTFNEVGKYYVVKSNDAHAWVEYFDKGLWRRVDPTGFISPDRILYGGDSFLTTPTTEIGKRPSGSFYNLFNKVKLTFDNVNYKVSLFFDNYDRTTQKSLSKYLKLNLKAFTALGFVLIGIGIAIFMYLTRVRVSKYVHPVDAMMVKLDKKIKNKNHKFQNKKSINDMRQMVPKLNLPPSEEKSLNNIITAYQKARYSNVSNPQEFSKLIKNFP